MKTITQDLRREGQNQTWFRPSGAEQGKDFSQSVGEDFSRLRLGSVLAGRLLKRKNDEHYFLIPERKLPPVGKKPSSPGLRDLLSLGIFDNL